MSRWSNWSRGTKPGRSLQDFLNEGPVDQLRTGNPTGNGTVSPADRAKQLGLQSNGKGGYIDPKSGQIVARTVNNELVFYSTGPTGGAISDGSGGADMARPSSSWQDPITGMMVTPPGKPETPNELAAIPDAVPAIAPAGYNEFIQRQKQQMYANDFKARENAKIQDQMPQQPEVAPETDPGAMMQPADPAMSPATAMENYLGPDLLKRMGGMGPPTFSDLRDRIKRSQIGQQTVTPPDAGEGGGQVPPPSNNVDSITGNVVNNPVNQSQPELVEPKPQNSPFDTELEESLESFQERIQSEKLGNGSQYVDLRGLLGDAKLPFAPRYLDMISRGMMANSDAKFSKLFPNLPMGAGSDKSRFGEIMSLVGAGLTPEQREIVFGAIEKNINLPVKEGEQSKTLNSPVIAKWLKGAKANSAGIDKYLKSRNNGQMPDLERVVWDVAEELEAIGIGGEDGEEKGYSTDIAVRTSNGNEQLSLKADDKAMLVNSTANKYVGYILNAAIQNENSPHYEQAKAYQDWKNLDSNVKQENIKRGKTSAAPTNEILNKLGLSGKKAYDAIKDKSKEAEEEVYKYLSDKGLDHKKLSLDEHNELETVFSQLNDDGVFNQMSLDQIRRDPMTVLRDTLEEAGFEDLDEDLLNYFKGNRGALKKPETFDNEVNLPTAEKLAIAAAKAAGKPIGNKPNRNARDYDRKMREYEQKIADAVKEYNIEDRIELFDRYRDNYGEAHENSTNYGSFMNKLEKLVKSGMTFPEIIKRATLGQLTGSDFGVADSNDITHKLEDLMYFSSLASGDQRALNHKQNALERQRNFRKNFSKLVQEDEDLREGVLGDIRKNFPLKDVSENLETMIIGDNVLDNNVLRQILGTDDYDEIKEKLVVYEDDKGKSILGFKPQPGDIQYQLESPDRTIPIANLTQRSQRPGRGGSMKHDMLFHKDFNKAIKEAQIALGLTESKILELLINLTEDRFFKALIANRLKSRYNI